MRTLWLLLLALSLTGCFGQRLGGGGGGGGDDDDSVGDDDDDAVGDDDDDVTPSATDLDGDTITNLDEGDGVVDTDGDGTADQLDGDSDNDGISDLHEAGDLDPATAPVDTDGDGTPDFRDGDSDGDGIADSLEAGDDDPGPPPRDSDFDGIPDFQETDADGDGMLDEDEGTVDHDGDGLGDWQDPDSDGDGIDDALEKDGDADGDGIPNYLDDDSDGDGLPDALEGGGDHDGDGVINSLDDDSDGDGLSDAAEGAVDSDGDGLIDALDVDSDNDLLSDAFEAANGSDPTSADSDGDGTTDLIELGTGTDPNDPNDNFAENGDLVFVVPPREPTTPAEATVATTTNFQQVDLYVLLDHTCSMDAEIAAMKGAATDILNDLTCDPSGVPCVEDAECGVDEVCSLEGACIQDPAVYECIPSFWSGSGEFGGSGDPGFPPFIPATTEPVENNLSIQPSPTATASSIPASTGDGSDEVVFRSAQCVAQPAGCTSAMIQGCSSSGIGCPGFRADAVRILLQITDEDDQCMNCPGVSAATAGSALAAQGIAYVGVNAGTNSAAQADLEALATAAGSLDSAGQPFVRQGTNSAVVQPVIDAILEIIGDLLIDTSVELAEVSGDSGDALPFLDHVEVVNAGEDLDADGVPDCSNGVPTADLDSDGFQESHQDLLPGTPICWNVVPMASAPSSVVETAALQTFQLEMTIRGNGSAILDQVQVFFLVPPFAPQ
jgi:hypothetical protein